MKGISVDGQFNEGRQTIALGVKLDYNKKYSLDLSYVSFRNAATWDLTRDRDFYSLGVAVTF